MATFRTQSYFFFLIGAAFALLGNLAPAFSAEKGLDILHWGIGSACTVVTMLAVVWGSRALPGASSCAGWIAGLLLAVVLPLATETALHPNLANLSIALTALAFAVSHQNQTIPKWFTSWAANLGSTMCEPTALLWPIACFWKVQWSRSDKEPRGRRFQAVVGLGVAVVGLVFGRALGFPWSTTVSYHGPGAALQRDLAFLLPALLVGLPAYLRVVTASDAKWETQGVANLESWTRLCVLATFLLILGVPLNVRLCAMPFFWWVSGGLSECAEIWRNRRETPWPVRVAMGSAAVLLGALLVPSLNRFTNGPLMALHLFAP